MLCVPTASVDVVSAAWLEPLSVPVPRSVALSKKLIAPVAAGATVAVNVTLWPGIDGFAELASVVVVAVAPPTVGSPISHMPRPCVAIRTTRLTF